ncbi:MAG: hypothetical protein ABIS59_02765 [Candidatus Saccharibacteria bacterium]
MLQSTERKTPTSTWSEMYDKNAVACLRDISPELILKLAKLYGKPLGETNAALRDPRYKADLPKLIEHHYATLTGSSESPTLMCLSRIEKLCACAVSMCIKVTEREKTSLEAVLAEAVGYATIP